MRYRRSSYRYATVVGSTQTWVFSDVWQTKRPLPLARTGFRPDVDACETAAALEIVVDLAGVDEDDFEMHLFEDALIVEGTRRLPPPAEAVMYHAATIRQGPFRVEVPLPVPIDTERVEARYDRGLLRVTLAKRKEAE